MSIPYIDLTKKANNYAKIEKLLNHYIHTSGWEENAYSHYVNFLASTNDNGKSLQQFSETHNKILALDEMGYIPKTLYSSVVTSTINSKSEPDFLNFFHAFSAIEITNGKHSTYLIISHVHNGRRLFEFRSYRATGKYIFWNEGMTGLVVNKQPIRIGTTCRQIENAVIAWWNETDGKHRKSYPGSCTGITDTLIYLYAKHPKESINLYGTDREKRSYISVLEADENGMIFHDSEFENPIEKLEELGFSGINTTNFEKFLQKIKSIGSILGT